ncbi:hypothetical protein Tco_0434601 [Tanacetum coccineum]
MNKKDSSKGEEIKKESKEEVKEEDKGEENTRKRKHDEQDEFWNSQHEWKVVSWKLHSSSGVHTLDGLMKGSQLTLLLGEELASPRSNSSW